MQNASAEADQTEAAGGWLKVDLNTSRGPDSGRGGFSGGRGRGRFDGGGRGRGGRDGESYYMLCMYPLFSPVQANPDFSAHSFKIFLSTLWNLLNMVLEGAMTDESSQIHWHESIEIPGL